MRNINYLFRSTFNYFNTKKCPYCGHNKYKKIDQKYIVTKLLECDNCNLMYRFPNDKPGFNEKFYNSDYEEKGLTTDLPDENTLKQLLDTNFINSEKDFSIYVSIFNKIKQSRNIESIVDYGANWGYGSLQFQKAGYKTQSFEISKPRATFGKKAININIFSNINELSENNDVIFSAHVIEHLNDIDSFIKTSKQLLKPEGIFYAACPNGSDGFRLKYPKRFHLAWGLVHPNYISDKLYKFIFKKNPYLISSQNDFCDLLSKWDYASQVTGDLTGSELYVAALPNIQLFISE